MLIITLYSRTLHTSNINGCQVSTTNFLIKKLLPKKIELQNKRMKPIWINREQMPDLKSTRAGVMPYIRTNKGIWFCFGRDSVSGELRDLSGICGMFDKDSEDTALKSCRSESLHVFDFTHNDLEIMETLYLVDFESSRIIILLDITNLDRDMKYYRDLFSMKRMKVSNSNISELVWVAGNEITEIISKKHRRVSSDVRSHIRDISKIVPIINIDSSNELMIS